MSIKNRLIELFLSKRLNILGVKRAGKSQILETLGCPDIKAGFDSQAEQYSLFCIDFNEVGSSKKVYIHGGCDYGGELNIFKNQYEKMMRKGDVVLFVIDAVTFFDNPSNDYENDIDYRMSVLRRIDVINKHTPQKCKNKFFVVLTHADSFADRGMIGKQFQAIVDDEQCKTIAHWIQRYFVIDATNKQEVLEMFKKILL